MEPTAFALFATVLLPFVYAAPTCFHPHAAWKIGISFTSFARNLGFLNLNRSHSLSDRQWPRQQPLMRRDASFMVKEFCHVLEDAILYTLEFCDFMQVVSKVGFGGGSDGRGSLAVDLRTIRSRANESLSHLRRVFNPPYL